MPIYTLYVKTHLKTGKKYFGYTKQDPFTYKGSGKIWKLHVNKHGNDVWTNVVYQSEYKEMIYEYGLYYSDLWNIVESDDWLNLRPEVGDGGDTVSNKKWITDGINDKYQCIDIPIPDGWTYGRSKCIWKPTTVRSETARKNMSLAQMGEKHHLYGKKRPDETKQKIAESHKGKKKKPWSEETREKHRRLRTGKKRGPYKKRVI